jgi:hypothetical protein
VHIIRLTPLNLEITTMLIHSLLTLTLLAPLTVLAAPAAEPATGGKTPTEAQCQRDLSKFEQAIAFARQAQGQEAAAKLRERLLPAQLENDLLAREGACGLAKHLRDKRLLD